MDRSPLRRQAKRAPAISFAVIDWENACLHKPSDSPRAKHPMRPASWNTSSVRMLLNESAPSWDTHWSVRTATPSRPAAAATGNHGTMESRRARISRSATNRLGRAPTKQDAMMIAAIRCGDARALRPLISCSVCSVTPWLKNFCLKKKL